jgi:hypothetical protein
MTVKNFSLQLQDGEAEALLHILWLRLVKIVGGYQRSYAEDVEITMIKGFSEQLGEKFVIVLENGVSKVAPRVASSE